MIELFNKRVQEKSFAEEVIKWKSDFTRRNVSAIIILIYRFFSLLIQKYKSLTSEKKASTTEV